MEEIYERKIEKERTMKKGEKENKDKERREERNRRERVEERDKEISNLYYLDLSHFKGKVNSSHTHYIIFFIDLSVSCEN